MLVCLITRGSSSRNEYETAKIFKDICLTHHSVAAEEMKQVPARHIDALILNASLGRYKLFSRGAAGTIMMSLLLELKHNYCLVSN